jgi:hypothetical protein
MAYFSLIFLIGSFICLCGCTSFSNSGGTSSDRLIQFTQIAHNYGFKTSLIASGDKKIMTASRISNPNLTARLYIEGDGNAFITYGIPSGDPTPKDMMLFKLAANDPSPNVIYIGRPCQYHRAGCGIDDWTTLRFTKDKINEINHVVDILKGTHQISSIELVGFSGGAYFAAHLAAQRCDVTGFRSLAGNMDLDAIRDHYKAGPLSSAGFADTQNIPQLHLASLDDQVVPVKLIQSYMVKNNISPASLLIVDGPTHATGWENFWADFIKCPLPDNKRCYSPPL